MNCVANAHELVALGNLYPEELENEVDSFMFQSVGHQIISLYSEAIGAPLYRQPIKKGSSINRNSEYTITPDDEVENLVKLIEQVKKDFPDIEAVASGAILSNYQRVRIEHVCSRFGLVSLAYLWQRDQSELLNDMIVNNVDAIVVKVASAGLSKKHVGKSIAELQVQLEELVL
jgi:diphthine-ammonia ligase